MVTRQLIDLAAARVVLRVLALATRLLRLVWHSGRERLYFAVFGAALLARLLVRRLCSGHGRTRLYSNCRFDGFNAMRDVFVPWCLGCRMHWNVDAAAVGVVAAYVDLLCMMAGVGTFGSGPQWLRERFL